MASDPKFQYNIQSHEDTAYVATEYELKSLGSFNFTSTLVLILAGGCVSIAVAIAMNSPKWTLLTCVGVFFLGGVALALACWCRREVLLGKSLVQTIMRRPKSRREDNGNGS